MILLVARRHGSSTKKRDSSTPRVSMPLYHALTSKFSYHTPVSIKLRKQQHITHLSKIRSNHRPIRKLPARQRLQRLARRICIIVLDEDLANAVGLPAAAAGAGDFHFEDLAVFLAFFFDVFADFCGWLVGAD